MKMYNTLDAELQGRNRISRKLANNTYLHKSGDNIAIKLHSTDVVTVTPKDDIILNSGGWRTSTTKDRIAHAIAPVWYVTQSKGVWYVGKRGGDSYRFADGMILHSNGKVTGAGKDNTPADNKLKARIKRYAQLCADSLPLEKPGAGDCWLCSMGNDKGTLGDLTKDTDHLTSHMAEGYVVPSLVYNALKESRVGDMVFQGTFTVTKGDWLLDVARRDVKSAVRRYMQKRFGFAA